jgi:hypothetical protein
MTSVGVIPALDELEHGACRLLAGAEMMTVQELAFECGEEALAKGILIGVADGTQRRAHTCLPTAPT